MILNTFSYLIRINFDKSFSVNEYHVSIHEPRFYTFRIFCVHRFKLFHQIIFCLAFFLKKETCSTGSFDSLTHFKIKNREGFRSKTFGKILDIDVIFTAIFMQI